MPMRVGLTPTWRSSSSEPGTIAAATRKKAADEISAGTSIGQPVSRWPPLIVTVVAWGSPATGWRPTRTPKASSIRSV